MGLVVVRKRRKRRRKRKLLQQPTLLQREEMGEARRKRRRRRLPSKWNPLDRFLFIFSNPHTNTDANTVYNNVRKGCSTIITDGDCHHSSELIIEQKIDYMKLRCSLLLSTRLFYLFVLISQA